MARLIRTARVPLAKRFETGQSDVLAGADLSARTNNIAINRASSLSAGEVEAALSLGLSERDSRMEIIGQSATNALLPNLDSTRTVGLVTLPGAFVGVLLSTGSAAQAGCGPSMTPWF